MNTVPYSWKFSPGENFRQFRHLPSLAKILSTNFSFCVKYYIADMATFTILAKIYSMKYYCNTNVLGSVKFFCCTVLYTLGTVHTVTGLVKVQGCFTPFHELYIHSIITPRACTAGIVIGLSVNTKIARSLDVRVKRSAKCVEDVEKLSYLHLSTLETGHKHYKSYLSLAAFISHTYSHSIGLIVHARAQCM